MPSLFEGLSAAFIEAMAMGLDAVVSDIPSFHAPFESEPGLFFVNNTDLEGNAEALDQAISQYRFRPRPALRERFNRRKYCDRIEAAYRRIAKD
jgi:glycosyltransferase involved in cell wall biosynthesis